MSPLRNAAKSINVSSAPAPLQCVWEKSHGREEYAIRSGTLKIMVHRHIGYPEQWLVTCRMFDFQRVLKSMGLLDAKKEAISVVFDITHELAEAARRLREADEELQEEASHEH